MKKRTVRDQIALAKMHAESAKLAASARAAVILADFEDRLPQFFGADDAVAWERLRVLCAGITRRANDDLRKAARECGIPDFLAPGVDVSMHHASSRDGYVRECKADLRRRASARVTSMERAAVKTASDAVLPIIAALHDGLDVENAQARLDALPPVDASMPLFSDDQMRWLVQVATYSSRWRSREVMPE
jgi:hypothetical protein